MKYKITFEFFNEERNWVADYFSNAGMGFTLRDAEYIANDLKAHGCDGLAIRNVKIEQI